MATHLVKWNKKYCEDLGEQDADGLFDYAYCYFVYTFLFTYKQRVEVRRYTDTIDECSGFLFSDNSNNLNDGIQKTNIISVVINFMKMIQGVKHFNYLKPGCGYVPVILDEVKDNLNDFAFTEIIEKE